MQNENLRGPGDLGRRVAARRKELGLTRAELAARSGMAVSYLAYLEQHAANVSYDALIRLADALGTTPDALLGCHGGQDPGTASVPRQGTARPVSAPKLAPGLAA
ncbi:MAG TPA: helix-turn-helix transcriptional regulator [Streptosporangiaceae bacterium]|jgi:transcriptional regulator with XRE-family HTH domain